MFTVFFLSFFWFFFGLKQVEAITCSLEYGCLSSTNMITCDCPWVTDDEKNMYCKELGCEDTRPIVPVCSTTLGCWDEANQRVDCTCPWVRTSESGIFYGLKENINCFTQSLMGYWAPVCEMPDDFRKNCSTTSGCTLIKDGSFVTECQCPRTGDDTWHENQRCNISCNSNIASPKPNYVAKCSQIKGCFDENTQKASCLCSYLEGNGKDNSFCFDLNCDSIPVIIPEPEPESWYYCKLYPSDGEILPINSSKTTQLDCENNVKRILDKDNIVYDKCFNDKKDCFNLELRNYYYCDDEGKTKETTENYYNLETCALHKGRKCYVSSTDADCENKKWYPCCYISYKIKLGESYNTKLECESNIKDNNDCSAICVDKEDDCNSSLLSLMYTCKDTSCNFFGRYFSEAKCTNKLVEDVKNKGEQPGYFDKCFSDSSCDNECKYNKPDLTPIPPGDVIWKECFSVNYYKFKDYGLGMGSLSNAIYSVDGTNRPFYFLMGLDKGSVSSFNPVLAAVETGINEVGEANFISSVFPSWKDSFYLSNSFLTYYKSYSLKRRHNMLVAGLVRQASLNDVAKLEIYYAVDDQESNLMKPSNKLVLDLPNDCFSLKEDSIDWVGSDQVSKLKKGDGKIVEVKNNLDIDKDGEANEIMISFRCNNVNYYRFLKFNKKNNKLEEYRGREGYKEFDLSFFQWNSYYEKEVLGRVYDGKNKIWEDKEVLDYNQKVNDLMNRTAVVGDLGTGKDKIVYLLRDNKKGHYIRIRDAFDSSNTNLQYFNLDWIIKPYSFYHKSFDHVILTDISIVDVDGDGLNDIYVSGYKNKGLKDIWVDGGKTIKTQIGEYGYSEGWSTVGYVLYNKGFDQKLYNVNFEYDKWQDNGLRKLNYIYDDEKGKNVLSLDGSRFDELKLIKHNVANLPDKNGYTRIDIGTWGMKFPSDYYDYEQKKVVEYLKNNNIYYSDVRNLRVGAYDRGTDEVNDYAFVSNGSLVVVTNRCEASYILQRLNPIPCKTCSNSNLFTKGDANCDGKVDLIDFEIWRSEYLDIKDDNYGWQADFSCKSNLAKPNSYDFSIWKNNYLLN